MPALSTNRSYGDKMRRILVTLILGVSITACEKVRVYEARVEGAGLTPFTEYQEPGTPIEEWTIERDGYRVFMSAQARRGPLRLYVRTQTDPATTDPAVFWSEGTLPFRMDVAADCETSLQYFDNPANSYANNFLKSEYPDTYPHSPETEAPGLSAILATEACTDTEIGVRISVLDDAGEPLREHTLTILIEQVDWYYNPLWP